MAQRFVACDREQSFLMPPDVREWPPENHLAWFVIDAVGQMDLDAFHAAYGVDGRARPAYDPAMMVALLLYAYARGTRASLPPEFPRVRVGAAGCARPRSAWR